MLNPMYVEPFAGNLRVGYPRAQRPTVVLSVAMEDGSLEELLRVVYTGNADDEKIVRIEAGEMLTQYQYILKSVERAAGMAITPRSAS